MPRTVRDTNLETRNARARLAARHKPYFRLIDAGCHIGYRKGDRGGSWHARYFIGSGKYREQRLGLADDKQDGDGVHVLSFSQAQAKARTWFSAVAREQAGITHTGKYTFAKAVEDYMGWFRNNRKSVSHTELMINTYLLPEFGHMEVSKITAKRMTDWLHTLANMPCRLRTKKGQETRYKEKRNDDEAKRKRKSSANRILNILKAILNMAYKEGHVANDDQWRRVKPFAKVDHAKIRFLQLDECQRLINACDTDFRRLVQAALLTGCRYSELARLRCEDYIADNDCIYIRESKNGKPRSVQLNAEGIAFFKQSVAGRAGSELMLSRCDERMWRNAHQARPMRNACIAANIKHASFHILRHTYASHLAMKGVPLTVIAQQLGHSDTRICEKHYAHLCPSYVADMIKTNLPRFGVKANDNVVPIAKKSRAVS